MPDSPAIRDLQRMIAGKTIKASTASTMDRDTLVQEVLGALDTERLTVFVGAGLSYAAGFPTWSGLLAQLSDRLVADHRRSAFELLARVDSPLIVARYLKLQMAVHDGFHDEVGKALYGGRTDYSALNPTLELVLALAERAQARGARLDIITYNFDNLLEHSLETRLPSVTFDRIATDAEYHRTGAALRVLHVHGYLDPEGHPILPPPPLVLSEDDFHRLMNNPAAWQNRVQKDALCWRDCLFVGLSMSDPNLRRLLDFASCDRESNAVGARWIIGRTFREGDIFVAGEPPLDNNAAETLNEIKVAISSGLSAVAYPINDFSDCGLIADAIRATA